MMVKRIAQHTEAYTTIEASARHLISRSASVNKHVTHFMIYDFNGCAVLQFIARLPPAAKRGLSTQGKQV